MLEAARFGEEENLFLRGGGYGDSDGKKTGENSEATDEFPGHEADIIPDAGRVKQKIYIAPQIPPREDARRDLWR